MPTSHDRGLREGSGPRREIYGIQCLRALAATMVVFHHTLEESNGSAHPFSPGWLTTGGAAGVDIFFLISGFIMIHTSFGADGAPPGPGPFLLRRAARIYPAYWVCCLGMVAISMLGYLHAHPLHAYGVFASLVLLPTHSPLLYVSWTLVYEAYFYLVFALALVSRDSTRTAAIATGIIAAVLFLIRYGLGMPASAFLANPIQMEFCAGMWLAVLYRRNGFSLGSWLTIPALALLYAAPLFSAHPNTNGLIDWPRVFFWGIPGALLLLASLRVGTGGALSRFGVRLGDASYGLYLTHPFLTLAYAAALKRTGLHHLPQPMIVAAVVAASIAVALAFRSRIEKPLDNLLRRRLGRALPVAATVGQPV